MQNFKGKIIPWFIPAICGLGLLIGCGGKDAPEEKPEVKPAVTVEELKTEKGASRMIEKDEVEAIYGFAFEDVQTGQQTPGAKKIGASTCAYRGSGQHSNQLVAISLEPLPNGLEAAEAFEKMNNDLGKSFGFGMTIKLDPVEGLGQKAGWLDMMGLLYVFKGKFQAIISATAPEGKTSKEMSVALASKAISRMP